MMVLQLRYDVFPLRNRNFNKQYQIANSSTLAGSGSQDTEDDLFIFQDYMRTHFDQNCKVFFILRDFYLLTRVQVTGTVTFYIKKDDKHFFGCKYLNLC